VTVTATMIPAADVLPPVVPTERITETGRPAPGYREELRRVPSARNAVAVVSAWGQTIGIIWLAVWLDRPVAWIAAFLLMGRAHAQLAALMHEAAHRTLFRTKRVNDFVGRWLLGFPAFTPIDLYRRGHMAHHRQEFGPDEPDIPLYRGYPITRASMRRKLVRDATGRTGWKLFKGLVRGVVSIDPAVRFQARAIVGCQIVLIAICVALGHPWLWLLMWFLPYLTVWRVINRLRAIAEHGGLHASKDRRETTHCVRQTPIPRFCLVPYHIGFHLAHHMDPGVPWTRLPEYERELRRAGFISPGYEYRSYRALWSALSSRPAES
jgi:fatty acid desaturase